MGRKKRVGIAVAVAAAGALAASLLVAATSGLPSAVAARSAFTADSTGSSGTGSGTQPIDTLVAQGKDTFRFNTFGDEAFWGDTLQLHLAIAGAANGGVGGGVSPRTALAVGLKVDVDALQIGRASCRERV